MTIVLRVSAIPVHATLLPMADAEASPWRPTLWSAILIGVLVVLFLVVSAIRRWMHEDDSGVGPSAAFTLGDLRTLHRQGKMTDDEFEKAKALMIGQTRRDAERAMQARTQKLKGELGARPDTAADLAAFAETLRQKAAREQAQNAPPTPPPAAPASGED